MRRAGNKRKDLWWWWCSAVGNSRRIIIGGCSFKAYPVRLLHSQSDGCPAGGLTPDLPVGLEMMVRWVLTGVWADKLLSCPVTSYIKC